MSTIVDKRAWLRAGIGTPATFPSMLGQLRVGEGRHARCPRAARDLLAAQDHGLSLQPSILADVRGEGRGCLASPAEAPRRRDPMLAFMRFTSCPPDPSVPGIGYNDQHGRHNPSPSPLVPPHARSLRPGLLAVEVLLWLSERFGWLGWHKGYAVLTGVAVVGVAMVLMLVWFGVALVFRWRFQFSIRSLLVLVVVVAVPCSWLAVEMKKAREQKTAAAEIRKLGGLCISRLGIESTGDRDVDMLIPFFQLPPAPTWLRDLLGNDFFTGVRSVGIDPAKHTGGGMTSSTPTPRGQPAVGLGRGSEVPPILDATQRTGPSGTDVTDVDLERLSGLSELDVLDSVIPKSQTGTGAIESLPAL